jgi:hypothetical protein
MGILSRQVHEIFKGLENGDEAAFFSSMLPTTSIGP